MKNTLFVLVSLPLLMLPSCKEKNKSIYEGCCGTEATVDSFRIAFPTYDQNGNIIDSTSAAQIYIPNVFTPDGDGINDIFIVFGGPTVKQIVSVLCSNENIDQFFHSVNIMPNDPGHSWDGLKPDGTIYQGSFNYEVEVEFIDGQIKMYIGKACAYICSEEGFPTENLQDCFLPDQHNGNGGLDKSIPSSEECF
ncbi:MAG: hypothetical protein ACKVU0_03090 [Saprospiraceae bacterium]